TAASTMLEVLDKRRQTAMDQKIKLRAQSLNVGMAKLDALSPLGVLNRGYSITQNEDGSILRDASMAKPGAKLIIRLQRGKLNAEVLSVVE
ncbi:MAG: exodeoxyribonuclease VII large subunit, partial [Pyrinomonadaceae bacterium]